MCSLFSMLNNLGNSYSLFKVRLCIKIGFLLFFFDGSKSFSQSIDMAEFTGTVPFACSFSGWRRSCWDGM